LFPAREWAGALRQVTFGSINTRGPVFFGNTDCERAVRKDIRLDSVQSNPVRSGPGFQWSSGTPATAPAFPRPAPSRWLDLDSRRLVSDGRPSVPNICTDGGTCWLTPRHAAHRCRINQPGSAQPQRHRPSVSGTKIGSHHNHHDKIGGLGPLQCQCMQETAVGRTT